MLTQRRILCSCLPVLTAVIAKHRTKYTCDTDQAVQEAVTSFCTYSAGVCSTPLASTVIKGHDEGRAWQQTLQLQWHLPQAGIDSDAAMTGDTCRHRR